MRRVPQNLFLSMLETGLKWVRASGSEEVGGVGATQESGNGGAASKNMKKKKKKTKSLTDMSSLSAKIDSRQQTTIEVASSVDLSDVEKKRRRTGIQVLSIFVEVCGEAEMQQQKSVKDQGKCLFLCRVIACFNY